MPILEQALPGTGSKKCVGCLNILAFHFFTKHKQMKDGLHPRCKSCRKLDYDLSRKKCTVPSCKKLIDPYSTRCIKHANIKKNYENIDDKDLDNIILNSKCKENINSQMRKYREQGMYKKKCQVPSCNNNIEKTANLCSSHAAIKQHHPELTLEKVANFKIRKKDHYMLAKWSKLVRLRDNNICQKCFISADKAKLHAHHIRSRAKNPEIIFDINNGITLCDNCHYEQHRLYGLQ